MVEAIGVYSNEQVRQVRLGLSSAKHRPPVSVRRNWYY
ncbi:MAG: hypothetical protein GX911_03980 [Spirochaetales bacterium]|nr:hypothetical protein [Spirochaetales bacterium]